MIASTHKEFFMNTPITYGYCNAPKLMQTHGGEQCIDLEITVRGRTSKMTVYYGLMQWEDIKCWDSIVIKCDLTQNIERHMATLFMNGFGACIISDYGYAARAAVRALCKERGWQITNEFSHVPILHINAFAPGMRSRKMNPNPRKLRQRLVDSIRAA
jgi:hypothetical protein